MKLIKITALILFTLVISVFIYANVRSISPSEKLKRVQLATFTLTKEMKVQEANTLQQILANSAGVTACKVNPVSRLASFVYQPEVISEQSLQEMLSDKSRQNVSVKIFDQVRGGCPVHAIGNSFNAFISKLDLRIQ